jgi:hypothetical protein
MSDNLSKINKSSSKPLREEEESYELVVVGRNPLVKDLGEGQGQQNTGPHIYENTLAQAESRTNSKALYVNTR